MVDIETNSNFVLWIYKNHCFLIKKLFSRKALTSCRLLSSMRLFCCNSLRQLDFTCVFGKANTAC